MSNVISISANEPVGPVVFPMDLIDSLDKRLEQLSGLIAVLAIELPPECHKRARYGVGLGEAFRSVLQSSTRKVPGWPKKKAGPGIVDAGALVNAALPATVPAPQSMAAAQVHPRIDAIAMIGGWSQGEAERWAADKLNAAPTELAGRLEQVGAELSLVLLRSRLTTSGAPAPVPMSGSRAPVVSARLRQLAPGL